MNLLLLRSWMDSHPFARVIRKTLVGGQVLSVYLLVDGPYEFLISFSFHACVA